MVIKSPLQEANPLSGSVDWGKFIVYSEYGEDGFALRSVCLYENGYITRYDRAHWKDQFGALPDFRYGEAFVKHWGKPQEISSDEFECLWRAAEFSKPYTLRNASPAKPCTWIELFQSGKWGGQP